MTATFAIEDAHRHCAAVTQDRARNFYYGIRLLPPAKRRAMCAVYAFARRVDDIGDGQLPDDRKRAELDAAREDLDRIGHDADDPVLVALADVHATRPLPLGAFGDLIEGVRMDVDATEYKTFDDLVTYCRRVAGSIGRLSVAVFGTTASVAVVGPGHAGPTTVTADALADDLGVAMQLTNILRDVAEDRADDRVYLPAEDLEAFGCPDLRNGPIGDTAAFEELVRFEAARAREWFDRGLELLGLLDRRSAACVNAMTGIYRRLLTRIEADPGSVLRTRVSLPSWEKGYVAIRSLAGVTP